MVASTCRRSSASGSWRSTSAARSSVVLELPGRRPSGLGWRPDGSMLVVSMRERQVLAPTGAAGSRKSPISPRSSTATPTTWSSTRAGNAYVGSFGYDYAAGEERRAAVLVLVDAAGSARVVADDVWFPNGMAITPDGRTLLLAETSGGADHRVHDRAPTARSPSGACSPRSTARAPTGSRSTPRARCGWRRPVPANCCAWPKAAPCSRAGARRTGWRRRARSAGPTAARCSPAARRRTIPAEAAEGRSVIAATRVDVPAA